MTIILILNTQILQLKLDEKLLAMVSLDLRKAFESVIHKMLLKKLEWLGVRRVCHKWFVSYLENRKSRVLLDKINSF